MGPETLQRAKMLRDIIAMYKKPRCLKQTAISLSSCETEFYAATSCAGELLGLAELFVELHYNFSVRLGERSGADVEWLMVCSTPPSCESFSVPAAKWRSRPLVFLFAVSDPTRCGPLADHDHQRREHHERRYDVRLVTPFCGAATRQHHYRWNTRVVHRHKACASSCSPCWC